MIPKKTVEELIAKHSLLEKDLSSGNIDKKLFAEKSKEYSDLNELGISAYISPNYSGIGPTSKGNGDPDYTCYLTPSYQEKSARGAMQVCDTTMSLFLGNSVSVGRLRQVVNELEENGPTYMPGECCLDTAATSARFGFNVSISNT